VTGAGNAGATGAAGATGVTGASGKAVGATGLTGATGTPGSQHAYSATGKGGAKSQTLTLTAPAGAGRFYVATANAEGTVEGASHPLTCTLKFGSTSMQSIVLKEHDESPAEVGLKGAAALTSGSISLTCTSNTSSDYISNLSLSAYAVSGVN
jgi:hypothetical protein